MKKILVLGLLMVGFTGCYQDPNSVATKIYNKDVTEVSTEVDTGIRQKPKKIVDKSKTYIKEDTKENIDDIMEITEENNKITKEEDVREIKVNVGKEKVETEIATFSTDYGSWDVNRTHNMTLATNKINNKIIKPNETFSFNDTVGERNEAAGYKLSTIFVDKEKVQGLGGGICQVSSTLYNAVLATSMTVDERHEHKRDVIYVPDNKDATVSYGQLDFKFTNTYDEPVKIKAEMKDDVLTTSIVKLS